ncbi:MAG: threonine/serine exporter family protein [Deltaproteobacteria bacterium]|nr:threonine/serine exporter family protein [Deltaproteobacteria bacterium]
MGGKHPAPSCDELLSFMAEYGRSYIASGGPTSRLEEALAGLGLKLDVPTDVFATPTGIFVSCHDQTGANRTTLSRIKDSGINLGKLCWLEGIFEDVMTGKLSVQHADKILRSRHVQRSPYKLWQMVMASFLSGFALSVTGFSLFWPALASGFISMATWWVSGPGLRSRVTSSIFRDFMGAVVTLGLASVFQLWMAAPFEALSIGGLVILVPGLTLTTAIAELADQNLVSGTAKLMQAVLTLLALGLAYMLFQDLSEALHLAAAPSAGPRPQALAVSAFGMMVSAACWSVIFRVPPRSLPWATLTGMLGWFILKMFASSQYLAAASFLAALAVGFVSLAFSTRYKVPSQVFSVPGIIAMLPGMLALTSLRSFAAGNQDHGLELGFRVAATAGSIVFGLFTARIPFAFKPRIKLFSAFRARH